MMDLKTILRRALAHHTNGLAERLRFDPGRGAARAAGSDDVIRLGSPDFEILGRNRVVQVEGERTYVDHDGRRTTIVGDTAGVEVGGVGIVRVGNDVYVFPGGLPDGMYHGPPGGPNDYVPDDRASGPVTPGNVVLPEPGFELPEPAPEPFVLPPPRDAAPPPSGGTPDGGTPDGGTPDGGTPDGGTPDGGTPDGGTPPDGGSPDVGGDGPSGGRDQRVAAGSGRSIGVVVRGRGGVQPGVVDPGDVAKPARPTGVNPRPGPGPDPIDDRAPTGRVVGVVVRGRGGVQPGVVDPGDIATPVHTTGVPRPGPVPDPIADRALAGGDPTGVTTDSDGRPGARDGRR